MKRILLIILTCLFVTGCVQVNNTSLDNIISTTLDSKLKIYNQDNGGYKYYLPRQFESVVKNEYNEIIKSKRFNYYLYIDLVSYYNEKNIEYEANENIYYSKIISKDDKKGIVEIDKIDDEYFVDIRYNYAKVEVKCEKQYLNEAVSNALVILSSIDYNSDIIKKMLESDSFSSTEEIVNVFDSEVTEDNRLDVSEDIYTGNEVDDYDPDVIIRRDGI